jgi:hypothetical protein
MCPVGRKLGRESLKNSMREAMFQKREVHWPWRRWRREWREVPTGSLVQVGNPGGAASWPPQSFGARHCGRHHCQRMGREGGLDRVRREWAGTSEGSDGAAGRRREQGHLYPAKLCCRLLRHVIQRSADNRRMPQY